MTQSREYPPGMVMPPQSRELKVWTGMRRAAGNLIPAAAWIICVGYGVFLASNFADPLGEPLRWMIAGTVAAWWLTNWFGLFQNFRMRSELKRIVREPITDRDEFVGFARPSFGSFTDAHEDVGFLCLGSDRIKFISEQRVVQVYRTEIRSIHFRPNVHSVILLGRWIAIEGISDGQKIRLLVEPRRYATMFANLRYSRTLRHRLQEWWKNPPTT